MNKNDQFIKFYNNAFKEATELLGERLTRKKMTLEEKIFDIGIRNYWVAMILKKIIKIILRFQK